jgi:hypothetical protein
LVLERYGVTVLRFPQSKVVLKALLTLARPIFPAGIKARNREEGNTKSFTDGFSPLYILYYCILQKERKPKN